jgi:hypothetical protein
MIGMVSDTLLLRDPHADGTGSPSCAPAFVQRSVFQRIVARVVAPGASGFRTRSNIMEVFDMIPLCTFV